MVSLEHMVSRCVMMFSVHSAFAILSASASPSWHVRRTSLLDLRYTR